jgi:hypothetical protein
MRAPCSLPAKTYGLECREAEWEGAWSSVGQIKKHDSELLHPCKCAQLLVRECTLDRLYFQRCWMHLRLRGGSFGISDKAGENNAGENNAAGGEASLAPLAHERDQRKDQQDTCGSADGADDGGAGAMDMTETLEPSVERVETSHPGTPHAAPVREEGAGGAGEASGTTSVEELSIGSPTATANRAGLGSSYMAMASSLGGVSGEGGSGGSGAMGSSSTVKTYRHPTSSKQRNLIREKFAKALSPFYREGEDKYSPLTAAIAMEHSSYRYFGKVRGVGECVRARLCVCVYVCLCWCVCVCVGVSLRQQLQWSIRVTAIFIFIWRCAGVGRGCMGVGRHACVYDTDLAIVICRAEVYTS